MNANMLSRLTLVTLSIAVGCGGDAAVDDEPEQVIDDGKLDAAARPFGTYLSDDGDEAFSQGPFEVMVLKSDRTFWVLENPNCTLTESACPPAQDFVVHGGTYRFTQSGSRHYLRLTDDSGDELGRFAYAIEDGFVAMRRVYTNEWFRLRPGADDGIDWCMVADDCALQNVAIPATCEQEFICGDHQCTYRCP